MRGLPIYRTSVAPEWIDYNGHLRDAYYSVIVSSACDAFMDRVGIDEAYRKRTLCTLYTLEMHMHFLREVKQTDMVDVSVRILGTDRKRIHAAFDMTCERFPELAATAEFMLLHVHQGDEPKAQAFPPEVIDALARITAESEAITEAGGLDAAASGAVDPATGVSGSASGASGSAAGALGPAAAATSSAPWSPGQRQSIPGSRRIELRSRS